MTVFSSDVISRSVRHIEGAARASVNVCCPFVNKRRIQIRSPLLHYHPFRFSVHRHHLKKKPNSSQARSSDVPKTPAMCCIKHLRRSRQSSLATAERTKLQTEQFRVDFKKNNQNPTNIDGTSRCEDPPVR